VPAFDQAIDDACRLWVTGNDLSDSSITTGDVHAAQARCRSRLSTVCIAILHDSAGVSDPIPSSEGLLGLSRGTSHHWPSQSELSVPEPCTVRQGRGFGCHRTRALTVRSRCPEGNEAALKLPRVSARAAQREPASLGALLMRAGPPWMVQTEGGSDPADPRRTTTSDHVWARMRSAARQARDEPP
jgi:hypothetical protein